MAAYGLAFINGYRRQRPSAERLEVLKLMVDLGEDVTHADSSGITPFMAAPNLGDINIVQYLIKARTLARTIWERRTTAASVPA